MPSVAESAVAPMTTSWDFSASARIVAATLAPSTSSGWACSPARWRTNELRARSVCDRTTDVIPGGTTCRTSTLGVEGAAERVGEPERQFSVRAAADGGEDPRDLADATLLDHGRYRTGRRGQLRRSLG